MWIVFAFLRVEQAVRLNDDHRAGNAQRCLNLTLQKCSIGIWPC
jgi:hypothetical protein